MRLAALLLWVGCLQAAPLRVAVLVDDLPGLEPALTAHLRQVVAGGGHTVTALSAAELAKPTAFARARFEVLVLSHSPAFPGQAAGNVEAFLRAGGHLALLGGFAYAQPMARVQGVWRERAGFEQALSAVPNAVTQFGFDPLNAGAWHRSTNHPEHPSRLSAGSGPHGPCLRLELRELGPWQWDVFAASLPRAIPPEHDLFAFWARGGERTPQVLVELTERDGARWTAEVALTPQWRRIALETPRFRFHQDGSPAGRGGPGDRLRLAQVARVSFGLATAQEPERYGDHLVELDEVGTGVNALGVSLDDYRGPNTVCFDDYEPYHLREVTGAATCGEQDLVPDAVRWPGALSGLSAVGFTLWDRSRLIPLLAARDRHGRDRGWACATLVHYGGLYTGGAWLLSGVTTPAFYQSAAFDRCLTGWLTAAAGRNLPQECAERNQRRLAETLPLTTPPPAGLRRQGQHFQTADGQPFFLIGCDHIGSLDRKFFGGPWVHWLEADFRRARAMGLNSMRLYGASAFWREPQKLAELKECARRYGIYLLVVVTDHTELMTRAALEERCRQVAGAFRDEPMLLGYDLQNEPYAYRVAEVKDGNQKLGDRYPLWRRWGDYEQWAGLQVAGNFTSFPGVKGPLPRNAEMGPVLDGTDGVFGDWLRWQVAAIRAIDPTHPISVGYNSVFGCLPANADLDFVSHHAYQPPTSHAEVVKNLTTLDRLRLVWPDRPITLGEFGYSNGLKLPDGYLDLHSSAVGEFLHYLHAWAHGFAGAMKWTLTDQPLELSRQQMRWMPADDLPRHIEQGRYGMFWSDGTDDARPKPLMWALRFFREYVDAGGPRGELTVAPADNRLGTGYVFRAPGARIVGNRRHQEPGFGFDSREAAVVLVRWDARRLSLVATADATVRLDPVQLCGWSADRALKLTGQLGSQSRTGPTWTLELLEGEAVSLAAE